MQAIPLLIVLIILSALFSGLEIALFSVSEAKLRSLAKERGRIKLQALRVLKIKENPEKLLVTILIGNNVVNIAAASIATAIAIQVTESMGVGIATAIMTIVILIVGEILPKSLAQKQPDTIARWSSLLVLFLLYTFTPVSFVLELIAKLANRLTGQASNGQQVTEEEVKAMVHMGSESGTVQQDEKEMIENIFTLDDVTAEDVMTQSGDVVSLSSNLDNKDILKIITETGFSRFPVYSNNKNNIIGVLYTKDIMEAIANQEEVDFSLINIKEIAKPALFVPEQKPLDDLLRMFQKEKKHIALVVNEYGETRGLITLEDILEEIVGDIIDEQDEEFKSIKRVNKRTIIADADVHIEDIEKALNVELSANDHKSIAWVILNELGIVPQKGDELSVGNVKIIIEEAEEKKIKRVKLIKIR